MSLEAKIEELTRAVEALTAKIAGAPVAEKPSTPKQEKAKPAPSTGTTKESPVSSAPPATGELVEIDFARDIGGPFLTLYAANPNAAAELVKKFNAPKLSAVDKSRWPEIVTALREAGV